MARWLPSSPTHVYSLSYPKRKEVLFYYRQQKIQKRVPLIPKKEICDNSAKDTKELNGRQRREWILLPKINTLWKNVLRPRILWYLGHSHIVQYQIGAPWCSIQNLSFFCLSVKEVKLGDTKAQPPRVCDSDSFRRLCFWETFFFLTHVHFHHQDPKSWSPKNEAHSQSPWRPAEKAKPLFYLSIYFQLDKLLTFRSRVLIFLPCWTLVT